MSLLLLVQKIADSISPKLSLKQRDLTLQQLDIDKVFDIANKETVGHDTPYALLIVVGLKADQSKAYFMAIPKLPNGIDRDQFLEKWASFRNKVGNEKLTLTKMQNSTDKWVVYKVSASA